MVKGGCVESPEQINEILKSEYNKELIIKK